MMTEIVNFLARQQNNSVKVSDKKLSETSDEKPDFKIFLGRDTISGYSSDDSVGDHTGEQGEETAGNDEKTAVAVTVPHNIALDVRLAAQNVIRELDNGASAASLLISGGEEDFSSEDLGSLIINTGKGAVLASANAEADDVAASGKGMTEQRALAGFGPVQGRAGKLAMPRILPDNNEDETGFSVVAREGGRGKALNESGEMLSGQGKTGSLPDTGMMETDTRIMPEAGKNRQELMHMVSVDVSAGKAGNVKYAEISDKVWPSSIQEIEVISNRKYGDLRVLHLKLLPADLGTVEARLRMTSDGLHIRLQADSGRTARLLEAEHGELSRTLEKLGVQDYRSVSITVVKRSDYVAQPGSGLSHAGGDQSYGNNPSGQDSSFGHHGQSKRHSPEDARRDFSFAGRQQHDDLEKDDNTYRDTRRLVI